MYFYQTYTAVAIEYHPENKRLHIKWYHKTKLCLNIQNELPHVKYYQKARKL